MIIELIVGVIMFLILFYFFLELKSKLQLNKLRRKYDPSQDISRRGNPTDISRTTSSDNNRESNHNELVAPTQSDVRPVESIPEPAKRKPFPRWGKKEKPTLEELEKAVNENGEQPNTDDKTEQVN